MEVPLPLIVVAFSLLGGGLLSWAAYVTKQLVEHARLIAIVADRTERYEVAHAARHHEDRS